MTPTAATKGTTPAEARDRWFDELLATLSADRFMLEQNIASPEKQQHYGRLIHSSTDELFAYTREQAKRHFVSRMLIAYLAALSNAGLRPVSLAFDLNDHEVLVWATITDDDEAMERALILAEAEVNAQFHAMGYDLTTTIVEEGDRLPVPNHYIPFSLGKNQQ